LTLHTRELSVAGQRYQALQAVIGEGRTITEVAAQWRVSRQTVHAWLARYQIEGLEGLRTDLRHPFLPERI
jgi:transposase